MPDTLPEFKTFNKNNNTYPAPLLTELLERLPKSVKTDYGEVIDLWFVKLHDNSYCVCYKLPNEDWSYHDQHHPNPAESAALMLIHLLTNGLI